MNELQPIVELFPWVPKVCTVLMALRFLIKPFTQGWRERATAQLVDTAENGTAQEQDEILQKLHNRWYRAAVFWTDTLFSYKLPTHIEFERLVAKRRLEAPLSKNTDIAS